MGQGKVAPPTPRKITPLNRRLASARVANSSFGQSAHSGDARTSVAVPGRPAGAGGIRRRFS